MNDFDRLCKEFEQMDVLSYSELLTERSQKIIPALAKITQDGESGIEIFFTFILGAIAADNRLAEEEYELLYPMLRLFFDDNINYETAKKSFRQMKPEHKLLKNITDEMVDVLGLLSKDLKKDIVLVCMLICAVDGKISLKEKNWIRQLIR